MFSLARLALTGSKKEHPSCTEPYVPQFHMHLQGNGRFPRLDAVHDTRSARKGIRPNDRCFGGGHLELCRALLTYSRGSRITLTKVPFQLVPPEAHP